MDEKKLARLIDKYSYKDFENGVFDEQPDPFGKFDYELEEYPLWLAHIIVHQFKQGNLTP